MSSKTPPKTGTIKVNRRRSPTDASNECPASHKKAKKLISDTKNELFGTTKSLISSKMSTTMKQLSKQSSTL